MSDYLNKIIDKQHGSVGSRVVFLDIVKYSKRKSIMQQKVINSFNDVFKSSIEDISSKHVSDSQKQNLNLSTDIIKIPTGDGAAVVFPFDGLQNVHLDFSISFLNNSASSRKDESCSIFNEHRWCNCHSFFDVRIGVSDGKTIVYKDINDNYNVAGNAINIASRVMGIADGQQIIFTNDAFRNIIDMTEDTQLESKFVSHGKVIVKHDLSVDVCQYIGNGENFLNTSIPDLVTIALKQKSIGENNPIFSASEPKSPSEMIKHLEVMDVLKDLPLPDAFRAMVSTENRIKDKETAKLLVDAFKAIKEVMEPASRSKIIDS